MSRKKPSVKIQLVVHKLHDEGHKIVRDPIKMANLISETLNHLGSIDVHVEYPNQKWRKYVIIGCEKKP